MVKRYPRKDIDVNTTFMEPSKAVLPQLLVKGKGKKKCKAINARGKQCKLYAVTPQGFCKIHSGKSYASNTGKKKHSLYAKYVPSLKETFDSLSSLNEQMTEEVKLLRALLASTLVSYEGGVSTKGEILAVMDQLRKVMEYQAKFLPEKRPIDIESVDEVINKITNIIIMKVESPKILEEIVSDMTEVLTEVIRNAEDKSINSRKELARLHSLQD